MKNIVSILFACIAVNVYGQNTAKQNDIQLADMETLPGGAGALNASSILSVTKNYSFEQKNGTTSLNDEVVASEITSTYGDYCYAANLKNGGATQASYYSFVDANGLVKCSYLFTAASPYHLEFTDITQDYVAGTLTNNNNSDISFVVLIKLTFTGVPAWTKIVGCNVPVTAAWEKISAPKIVPYASGTRIACVHQESNTLPAVMLFSINDATGALGSNYVARGLVANLIYDAQVIAFTTDIAVLTDYGTIVVFPANGNAYNKIALNAIFKQMAMGSGVIYLSGGDNAYVAKLNISAGLSTGYGWVKSYSNYNTYGISLLANGNLGVTGGEPDVSGHRKTVFMSVNSSNGALLWAKKSTLLHTFSQVVGGTYGQFSPFLKLSGGLEYAGIFTKPNGTASTNDISLIEIDATGTLNGCYEVSATPAVATVSLTAANSNPINYSMNLYPVTSATVTSTLVTLDETTLCTGTTSIDEAIIEQSAFTVYPNPAGKYIMFNLPHHTGSCAVKIVNVTGQAVLSLNTTLTPASQQIDVSLLSSGIYFLEVLFDNSVAKVKFVKS